MNINSLLLTWGMLVLSVIFNVVGVFAVKWRLNELGPVKIDSIKNTVDYFLVCLKSPPVVAGVFLFFVSPFLFAIALSRMEISIAYPAQIGLNFLILILLGLIFLGEQWTMSKGIGMVLIFAGIYFLNK